MMKRFFFRCLLLLFERPGNCPRGSTAQMCLVTQRMSLNFELQISSQDPIKSTCNFKETQRRSIRYFNAPRSEGDWEGRCWNACLSVLLFECIAKIQNRTWNR